MRRLARRLPALVGLVTVTLLGCNRGGPPAGEGEFFSAPPAGNTQLGAPPSDAAEGAGGGGSGGGGGNMAAATPRTVEETDLYRLEGNRLYYLNSYRGFMVFDVSDVDHPRLLGRSPIFGYPVDMIVRNGVATVVVGDWFGQLDDGTPFHGSIVRGLDANDPTHIKVLGEAKLGGWVRDDRVVGDVIYAVSEDWGWSYGWWDGVSTTSNQETLVVSSVNFAGGKIQAVGKQTFPGYNGVFHVTPNAIMP
jgi:hypothetical protein